MTLLDDQRKATSEPVPDWLVGAWARRSVRRGDGPKEEPFMRTAWIQGRRHFADLRIPRDPGGLTRCFAGEASWSDGWMTWDHQIDSDPEYAALDTSRVSFAEGILFERGGSGRNTFEERYTRLNSGTDVIILRTTAGEDALLGFIAQVDNHRIVMLDRRQDGGELSAGYFTHDGESWVIQLEYGERAALPELVDSATSLSVGETIELPSRQGAQVWELMGQDGA